jgi:hypothetical protein
MPTSIMREGELKPRHKKALEFMMCIRDAFYDKDRKAHERTWNELLKLTGLRRKTLWKYLEKLKEMDAIKHVPAHYVITNAPITVKGEDPEGWFYWGTQYAGIPKYERGVLKRRGIKHGEKGPFFVAFKRPVEEVRKSESKKKKGKID